MYPLQPLPASMISNQWERLSQTKLTELEPGTPHNFWGGKVCRRLLNLLYLFGEKGRESISWFLIIVFDIFLGGRGHTHPFQPETESDLSHFRPGPRSYGRRSRQKYPSEQGEAGAAVLWKAFSVSPMIFWGKASIFVVVFRWTIHERLKGLKMFLQRFSNNPAVFVSELFF